MRSISVLVVDDDPFITDIIKEYIEINTGYIIDTVSSAQDAIEKLEHFPYDVIVSDYSMPEMNGLELLQQIRTFSQIPFILMTGTDNTKIVIDAINLGVDYYLKKGEDTHLLFTELIHMIERGAQRKRASDIIQENLSNFEKRFELSPIPTIISLSNGKINKINPAGISLFALSNPDSLQDIILFEEVIGEEGINRIQSGDSFSVSSQINFGNFGKKYPDIFNRRDTIHVDISFVPTTTLEGKISEYVIQIIDYTAEYLAKEELKKTGEQLGMALDGSRLGLWDWNIQTGEIICNDRWAEIIGYSHEELYPVTIQTWITHTHPKDLELSNQLLQKHFSGEIFFYECEVRMRHKNGHWVWIQDRGRVVELDPEGKPLRMTGTHADITDRKNAEEEVKNNKEKLQLILDSTAEAIFGFNEEGYCTFCNAACLKMLRYSNQDDLIGKNMHNLIHHTKRDGKPLSLYESRFFLSIIRRDGTHEDDEIFWRSDGTSFDAEYWSYPQYRDDKVIGAVVTFIDITNRKEIERALSEKNQQIESFFSVTLELLCIANTDGYFLRLNPSWEQVLGWSNDELMSKKFLDFVHPDDISSTLTAISELTQQNKVYNFINRYQCKDGRYRWLEWRSAPANNAIYAAAQDITDRKIYEDHLHQQRNILFEISSAATHLMSSLSDDSITDVLSRLGKAVGVSRTVLFTHSFDQDGTPCVKLGYEWVADGNASQIFPQKLHDLDWKNKGFTRWAQVLMNRGIIYGNVIDFPAIEQPFFLNLSIKSLAAVPIFSLDEFLGFLECCFDIDHEWLDFELETLEIAAGLLGATLGRQKAEDEVKIRETNLSTFFNTIDDFVFVLDTEGKILKVNDTVIHRLHYSEEELIGHSVLKIHPERRRQEAFTIVNDMLTGRCDFCQIPLISKDGMQIPVETRVVSGVWNGHAALFGVSKDISALSLSEEKFSKAFQSSGSLMAISELESGEFIDVNKSFIDTLGYSREEVIGKRSTEFGFFEQTDFRQRIVDDLKKTGYSRYNQLKIRKKDGKVLTGVFSANLIQIQNIEVILTVMDDITEVVQLTDSLLQANNKLHLLSSITRHDILNQVQALFFVQELMKQEIKPDNSFFSLLEMLEKAVDTIYHQILFTKDYQDLGVHASEWVRVESIINKVKQNKTFSSLAIVVNTGDLEIFVDPMFSKVCYNLFENALRHGEHVTQITIYFHKKENNGVIIFEDNGIGIPKAEKERIFEKGVGKNTGFGLFLTKEILSITGISIRETGKEGDGARFELVIPSHGFRFRSNVQ